MRRRGVSGVTHNTTFNFSSAGVYCGYTALILMGSRGNNIYIENSREFKYTKSVNTSLKERITEP